MSWSDREWLRSGWVPAVFAAAMASAVVACNSESDVAGAVKLLSDPARRPEGVRRLSELRAAIEQQPDGEEKSSALSAFTNATLDPLVDLAASTTLDPASRSVALQLLAKEGGSRAAPAFVGALRSYDPGKPDEDVKTAAGAVRQMIQQSRAPGNDLVQALWQCFSRLATSNVAAPDAAKEVKEAILAVKDASYVDGCTGLLGTPLDGTVTNERLELGHRTCFALFRALKPPSALPSLVGVLIAPNESAFAAEATDTLLTMPVASEPVLASAITGTNAASRRSSRSGPIAATSASWLAP